MIIRLNCRLAPCPSSQPSPGPKACEPDPFIASVASIPARKDKDGSWTHVVLEGSDSPSTGMELESVRKGRAFRLVSAGSRQS